MFSKVIPAYYASASLEEAWTTLVNVMNIESRGVIFLCAEPEMQAKNGDHRGTRL